MADSLLNIQLKAKLYTQGTNNIEYFMEVINQTATGKKKVIYNRQGGRANDKGWRTLEEIGEIEGVSKNRIHQIINTALEKIASSAFIEMNGRKPNEKELERLSKDESFQLIVSEELAATLSSGARKDP